MKKLLTITAFLFTFLFTIHSHADQCSKDILSQLSDINGSWRPIIDNPIQIAKTEKTTIIILNLYDTNKINSDPGATDIQAIFLRSKNKCHLLALTFIPIDVTKYLDLLME